MKENWRPFHIDGMIEGRNYEVSDLGRIRHSGFIDSHGHFCDGETTKGSTTAKGYKVVLLPCKSDHGYGYMKLVHRIVAFAFLDLPMTDRMKVVDHINGVRCDNRLENLRVVTHRVNTIVREVTRKCRYPGVIKNKYSYSASRHKEGKRCNSSGYNTEWDAHCAYMAMAYTDGNGAREIIGLERDDPVERKLKQRPYPSITRLLYPGVSVMAMNKNFKYRGYYKDISLGSYQNQWDCHCAYMKAKSGALIADVRDEYERKRYKKYIKPKYVNGEIKGYRISIVVSSKTYFSKLYKTLVECEENRSKEFLKMNLASCSIIKLPTNIRLQNISFVVHRGGENPIPLKGFPNLKLAIEYKESFQN